MHPYRTVEDLYGEDWEVIPNFPMYSISNYGRVFNNKTRREVATVYNQYGAHMVGLMSRGKQHKRAVGLLVAEAFLPRHEDPTFKSIIHVDGDVANNHVSNLQWRRRWFAIKYVRQFTNRSIEGIFEPIINVTTLEVYKDSWDAVTKLGVLNEQVMDSVLEGSLVDPYDYVFRKVDF